MIAALCRAARRRDEGGNAGMWIGGIGALLGLSVGLGAVFVVVWPGSMKLTAPIVCPDRFDDPVVVRDTYSPQPGETVTNFTLYCLDEDGIAHDAGFIRPAGIVTAGVFGVIVVLILLVGFGGSRSRLRRGHRLRPIDGSSSDQPPSDEPMRYRRDREEIGGADRQSDGTVLRGGRRPGDDDGGIISG